MALYDENGKITIDDVAANADIKRINASLDKLRASLKTVDGLIEYAASSQEGKFATAMIDKLTEIKKRRNSMISQLEETAHFIRKVVEHYTALDRAIKEAIMSSSGGASGGTN